MSKKPEEPTEEYKRFEELARKVFSVPMEKIRKKETNKPKQKRRIINKK